MVAKYFVWGAGAWRELDLSTGGVQGWRRRARFVFVRRGRLQVARRRAVLRALAALAAARPGAAADGPRLSQRSKSPVGSSKHRRRSGPVLAPPPCHLHSCCRPHYNGYLDSKEVCQVPPPAPAPAAPTARCEAGTQCGTARPAPRSSDEFAAPPAKRARKQVGRSRDELAEVTALLASRPSESSDDERPLGGARGEDTVELLVPDSDVAALRGFVARTRRSALARFDADAAYRLALLRAINPLVRLRRCAPLERLLRERRAAALPHFAARLGLTPRPAAVPAPSSRPAASLRPRRRREPSDYSDADKENKHSTPKKARTERSVKKTSEAGTASKPVPRPARSPPAAAAPPRSRPDRAASPRTPPARTLPARSARVRSEQQAAASGGGDGDVRVTRQSTGAKATPDASKRNDSNIAAKSGAGDVTAKGGAGDVTAKGGAGDVTAKGGAGDSKVKRNDSDVPVKSLNGDVTVKHAKRNRTDSDIEWSTSEEEPTPAPTSGPAPPQHTHVIDKRRGKPLANGRIGYSNLEDHAIVAWVCSGVRASLVNGNRVWRDLQEQFPRLAGRERTWHSLRNRYLRYLLPALGALALPPATVSRLRAAAATGVAKHRGGDERPRRNSIFKEAEPGAASRRPRPPPSPAAPPAPAASPPAHAATTTTTKADVHTESRALRRSPRYSEVTRQFAARHAPRPASSTDSSPAPAPSPAPSPRGVRSRRLYNPKQNV